MIKHFCLFTNDVETHSIWHNCLRFETGQKVLNYGIPLLLELYNKFEIKTTFFFTGYFAHKFPNAIKMVYTNGHEIGSHGYSHKIEDSFDLLGYKEQVINLNKSKKILEDLSGDEVISFRAPALRLNHNTAEALTETGFKIDSSIASQRFDLFMTFGSIKKLKWLFAPRLPYKTAEKNLYKSGNGPIIEVPLSALLHPYVGTTMRITPLISKIIRYILHIESGMNGKPIVFDIHPNEFLDENKNSSENRKIVRRSHNYFSYLLGDIIRGKLKVKNLGEKAIPLYRSEIEFFRMRNYKFTVIKDYVRKIGLMV
ncbi:MAG: polysaccharide deacetylase family protein [Promethearchaeota archaeon]